MLFSIIIPTLNEARSITATLQQLTDIIPNTSTVEIIISDGGSQDDTLQRVQPFSLNLLHSSPGRATQMNAGAQQANGDWLIFLHADTRLPDNWAALIEHSKSLWGRFDVQLSGRHWPFRIIEKAINIRSCITSIATGDQALFFRRDFFQQLGGFPAIPLMEDIAISKLARKYSTPACIKEAVTTSSRRWEQNGILRTILLMWSLRLAYWLGFKPATLHRFYYS